MDENVEKQAREIGWVAQEEFRGDQSKWVDAETYLKRGEEVLPYLQADRRRLLSKVTSQDQQLTFLRQSLESQQAELQELKASHSESTKAQLQEEIRQLRSQMRDARREGEVDTEMELEEKLEAARERMQAIKPPEAPRMPGPPQTQVVTEEVKAFMAENPWWEADPKMRSVGLAIGQSYQQDPAFLALSPMDRLNKIGDEVKEMFGMTRRNGAAGKVEAPKGSSGAGAPQGRSYNALPSEARDACDAWVPRMVGEGKRFKDVKEWQKHYVEHYDWR